jgi:hypothetical protein
MGHSFNDRDHETEESKELERPQQLTETEQESLGDRWRARKEEKAELKEARRQMKENEEDAYLRQTVYDSVYETTRDEMIGR